MTKCNALSYYKQIYNPYYEKWDDVCKSICLSFNYLDDLYETLLKAGWNTQEMTMVC